MIAISRVYDGQKAVSYMFRDLSTVLRAVHPKSKPDEKIFEVLKPLISLSIEIASTMRLEISRFVSIFPLTGSEYLPDLHSTGDEANSDIIELCTFPGIVKQKLFREVSPDDVVICKAKVYGSGTFEIFQTQ
jgi:hypothetical protein